AAGDQERVVAERPARLGAGLAAVDVDCRKRAERQDDSDLLGERAEVEVADRSEAEGLRHRHRAVPERRLRSEELDTGPALARVAQRQSRLERGDAATGDQNREVVTRHTSIVRRSRTEGIRESASTRPGFLRIRLSRLGGATEHAPSAAPEPRCLHFRGSREAPSRWGRIPDIAYETYVSAFRPQGRSRTLRKVRRTPTCCPQVSTGGASFWGQRGGGASGRLDRDFRGKLGADVARLELEPRTRVEVDVRGHERDERQRDRVDDAGDEVQDRK